jgi:hypothetical protein
MAQRPRVPSPECGRAAHRALRVRAGSRTRRRTHRSGTVCTTALRDPAPCVAAALSPEARNAARTTTTRPRLAERPARRHQDAYRRRSVSARRHTATGHTARSRAALPRIGQCPPPTNGAPATRPVPSGRQHRPVLPAGQVTDRITAPAPRSVERRSMRRTAVRARCPVQSPEPNTPPRRPTPVAIGADPIGRPEVPRTAAARARAGAVGNGVRHVRDQSQ